MSALVFCGVALVLGWSVARETAQRRRWREAERLSRALFAAAGVRRRPQVW
jgi:lipopolysaccharide biosynthesis regulator YciM